MNKILIMDLKNSQGEYGAALEFIKVIENIKYGTDKERRNVLLQIDKRITIFEGELEKISSPRYYEQPIIQMVGEKRIYDEIIRNRHALRDDDIIELIRKPQSVRYHIRIKFEYSSVTGALKENELIHLQYLAMLLESVNQYFMENGCVGKELRKYLTVFLIPATGDRYPFKDRYGKIDYETYDYASRYLRLLSKTYTGVIYGVNESDNNPVVTSLDFRKNKKCNSYFPLIIIDEKAYNSLFVESLSDIMEELFALKRGRRFCNSRDENPKIALKDFIAETDLNRIRDTLPAEEHSRVLSFLKSRDTISLMEFSFFAFILSIRKPRYNVYNSDFRYVNVWELAHEIARALKQVAQNAIQHTKAQECFFSFYFHEKDIKEDSNSFIHRIACSYPNTCFDTTAGTMALEIFISDLNDKEDMLDNFVSNLSYEQNLQRVSDTNNLVGHSGLIKCRDKLAIRNFFSVYNPEDAREAWKDFRQEDLVAHIGLSQFAQTARKCKASVKVISSKSYVLTDEKKYFYKVYGRNNIEGTVNSHFDKNNSYIIPGTQFSILMPVQLWEEDSTMGIGQLRQEKCAVENYTSFAKFLDYEEMRICLGLNRSSTVEPQIGVLDTRGKYQWVQRWKNYWEGKLKNNITLVNENRKVKYVFNYDCDKASAVSYFKNEDGIEVFFKGLISALDIGRKLDINLFVAFTNLPDGILDVFRKVCVQISVKEFPENVQLFLQEKTKKDKHIVMLGRDFSQAISNAYLLSMGHGVNGFSKEECENAIEIKMALLDGLSIPNSSDQQMIGVCPFDVILAYSEKDDRSLFEMQLKEMAEGSLDEELIGYKLNNTHMKLGSKVHIESFYEMSFLFHRTSIANRLAFNLLRQIKKKSESELTNKFNINFVTDTILFYGYASYSKALLTSINEILREYRKRNSKNMNCLEDKIALVSFQHNLMLESEETQMYYDLPPQNFPGNVDMNNHLNLNEEVKVIQVVPISSTLTTFDKMWRRLRDSVTENTRDKIRLAGNYTIFWVVDKHGKLDEGTPSDIEAKYWEQVLPKRTIKTKLPALLNTETREIEYFIRSAVIWHDPLKCKLCYPQNVIYEVPLVETDSTSTVPTQQIRYQGYLGGRDKLHSEKHYERFEKLQNCVFYDHIGRRQNHYQFYIDTQQYFYNAKDLIQKWLIDHSKELSNETAEPVLHIIFSPEHNTNVGFVQYVNTYYFHGLAEIVSLNVDKQFRSNFICEHAAIKRMIEKLHRDRRDMKSLPVRFYFVDDTVITGDTLQKANGLLHSLVPSGQYPVNLFSKIFVLMDRLSEDTKQMYVDDPKRNFIAFLHIDISNVRTHGDSCIGCKLEQNAMKLYKRSATQYMASYWYQKLYDYRKKAYDNREDISKIENERSYRMLLFSHVLQNVIIKQGNYYNIGDAFDVVLNISLWLLNEENIKQNVYGYREFLEDFRNMIGIYTLLKTVCRPFFSYDFKIKRQLYTFFILLTELMLNGKSDDIIPDNSTNNNYFSYLWENNRISKMEVLVGSIKKQISGHGNKELGFLKDYLLEGLTDMGSTYPMRMQTLKKFYYYIEKNKFPEKDKISFWNSYEVNIHRLVTGNADESRELWLEYMYMTGMEYNDFYEKYAGTTTKFYEPQFFHWAITQTDVVNPQEKHFYQFCHNLFLQNTGISFDELEEKCNEKAHSMVIDEMSVDSEFLKDCWRQMRIIDAFENPLFCENKNKKWDIESESKLFKLLINKEAIRAEQSVNQWYEEFLNCIVSVISEKYDIKTNDINIAMLTESMAEKGYVDHMQLFDIVKEQINSTNIAISETRYYIKERIVNALENEKLFSLKKNGYTISEDKLKGIQRPYLIAYFDNPQKIETVEDDYSLAKVFLYISISKGLHERNTGLIMRLILRDVMMYRNRILRFLKKDFAGEIYASYAHTIGEKNILSNEKAHSHNTTADDEISLEIFQGKKLFDKEYKILTAEEAAKWLLLRNYTNGQIAKIFNRSFHDVKGGTSHIQSPRLYIPKDSSSYSDNAFKQKLDYFADLNLKNDKNTATDYRFELLNEIIDIQCDESLNAAKFIQGDEGQYYNMEYFKCILIDIMLSAIKFKSDRPDYLTRVDRMLEVKEKLEKEVSSWDIRNEEICRLVNSLKDSRCWIKFFRKASPISDIDYLVIQNSVDTTAYSSEYWKEQNEIILHRLKDPLDYADGHMSLLAIKRYVENLDKSKKLECIFEYIEYSSEIKDTKELYFENKLPVLKR